MIHFGRVAYHRRQLLSMVLLLASILMARPLFGRPVADAAAHVVAFVLVLCGGALRSWAMGHHTWRRVHGEGSERSLITAGPYAMVRNPLYLGTLLISAGIALMSGSWVIITVYVALFWTGYVAIILWEERRLGKDFGDRYRAYFDGVPRLVPNGTLYAHPEGTFNMSTMLRCMEPAKTLGFMAALAVMLYLKQ